MDVGLIVERRSRVCLTDRRSAASNSADRIRSCHRSMPPDGNQGQLNRAVDGPLQRLVGRRFGYELLVERSRSPDCRQGQVQREVGETAQLF